MHKGSAISEISKQKAVVTEYWVESGFCAFLVLRYDDPENPQLEAMNGVSITIMILYIRNG